MAQRRVKPKLDYDIMLSKLSELIDKSHAALESKKWANVRPSDLIAFMVLAKDIIKETRSIQDGKGHSTELDTWLNNLH